MNAGVDLLVAPSIFRLDHILKASNPGLNNRRDISTTPLLVSLLSKTQRNYSAHL
jgi:hypothetical protein